MGCFHLLIIVKSAALNTGMQIPPEVRLLDQMVVLVSIFWGTIILFSMVLAPFYQHLLSSVLFSWIIVIVMMWGDMSLWFWFAFLWLLVMLGIFSYACWPTCISSLEKCSFDLFVHFLIRLFDFFFFFCCWVVRVLWIFWVLILYSIWFASIFSHSIACLFILLTMSLDAHKF